MSEHKILQQEQHFLDTKKVIILSLCAAITIGLIIFSILMLDVNFHELGSQLASAYKVYGNLIILMGISLGVYFVFKFMLVIWPYLIRLNNMGIHVPFKDKLLFVLTFCFIQAITPGAFITEPYILFWLKTRGVSTAKATAIVWINEFMWHLMSIVLMTPSFIILCMHYGQVNGSTDLVFWLAIFGYSVDCFMLVFFISIGISKKAHYLMSRAFNLTKKWLKLNYHTKEQTKQKYLIEGYLHEQARNYLRDWKRCLLIIFINFFCQVAMFTELYIGLMILNGEQIYINYFNVFNVVNVITTANKYLPIPGGEGMIQWQMLGLLPVLNPSIQDNKALIGNGIFMWRASTTYLPAIAGLGGAIIMIVTYAKAIIHKKKIIIKVKD